MNKITSVTSIVFAVLAFACGGVAEPQSREPQPVEPTEAAPAKAESPDSASPDFPDICEILAQRAWDKCVGQPDGSKHPLYEYPNASSFTCGTTSGCVGERLCPPVVVPGSGNETVKFAICP